MPTVLTGVSVNLLPPLPPRKGWTRGECATIEASGLLDGESFELVEGELIGKMGKKWAHVGAATMLHDWLLAVFGSAVVCSEGPIDVSPADNPTSEPVPDIVVLKRSVHEFQTNPKPEDLHLVVEVSDSSLAFDLNTKAGLYARAGIAEYWVLDLKGLRLIVHREPLGGRYQSVVTYAGNDSVSPLAAPLARVRPADILPDRRV